MATKKITDKTFEDITGHSLSNTSMLNLFNVLEDSDRIKFLNIFKPYVINETILANILYYYTYEVNDSDWGDMIAWKNYRDQNLWWVICLTNNIINPFEEIEQSMNMKILNKNIIPIIIREIQDIKSK